MIVPHGCVSTHAMAARNWVDRPIIRALNRKRETQISAAIVVELDDIVFGEIDEQGLGFRHRDHVVVDFVFDTSTTGNSSSDRDRKVVVARRQLA